jgi:Ca-activated chloride channel family protein
MKTFLTIAALSWTALWFTPDQQGQRLFDKREFKAAASHFSDPMRKGIALYRAGEFKEAQAVFARMDSAEAHYNRGNCLVFLGQYQDAVASYDRALSRRPDWPEATDNRNLAAIRAKQLETEGGDMGDQQIGADKIVFDKKKEGGQETQVDGDKPADNNSMQDLWLRRIQTEPADFLRNKFAYQQEFGKEAEQ